MEDNCKMVMEEEETMLMMMDGDERCVASRRACVPVTVTVSAVCVSDVSSGSTATEAYANSPMCRVKKLVCIFLWRYNQML
jgi:hypothetical protein